MYFYCVLCLAECRMRKERDCLLWKLGRNLVDSKISCCKNFQNISIYITRYHLVSNYIIVTGCYRF